MRRLFGFLLFVLLPQVSFGQISDEEYKKLNLDSINREESVTNGQYLEIGVNWKQRDLKKLEADMQQMNPELVESLQNTSDAVKMGEYKSWLAQKTFEDFYDRYMQDLQNYSQKLGREIKKREPFKGQKRGNWICFDYELSTEDLTDCHTEPEFGDRLCYEPDGYIRYNIRYTENTADGSKNLHISKDVPQENRSSSYSFMLDNRGNREFETSDGSIRHQNNYMLSYLAIDQEYDKIAKLRYYTVKDLLGGMCKITCKDCIINGKVVTMSKCDTDTEKYKSNLIPGFIGLHFMESYNNDNIRSK